ncbi:unnamed protein product [Dimorphilus gyrociliatus]|uniref:G-protein coupled receptors family 1 profile domain-containing protein n=1 Tax=Dimorphilus gyrociliatus TaxID=2664684 RepID=A0A7I8VYC6_9ANNE|nr:unnamed protein product [Dimorphilus gyrociliatus]
MDNATSTVSVVEKSARATLTVACMLGGIVLNVPIIIAIIGTKKLHTQQHILVCHLSLVHLLASSLIMPLQIAFILLGGDLNKKYLRCDGMVLITTSIDCAALSTISSLAVEYFLSLSRPFRQANSSKRNFFLQFSFIWILSICCGIISIGIDYEIFNSICVASNDNWRHILQVFVSSLLPILLTFVSLMYIVQVTNNQQRRIVAVVQIATLAVRTSASAIKIKSVTTSVAYRLGACIICYGPIIACRLGRAKEPVLLSIVTIFWHFAPIINAIVYGLQNRTIMGALKVYVRRRCINPPMPTTSDIRRNIYFRG